MLHYKDVVLATHASAYLPHAARHARMLHYALLTTRSRPAASYTLLFMSIDDFIKHSSTPQRCHSATKSAQRWAARRHTRTSRRHERELAHKKAARGRRRQRRRCFDNIHAGAPKFSRATASMPPHTPQAAMLHAQGFASRTRRQGAARFNRELVLLAQSRKTSSFRLSA